MRKPLLTNIIAFYIRLSSCIFLFSILQILCISSAQFTLRNVYPLFFGVNCNFKCQILQERQLKYKFMLYPFTYWKFSFHTIAHLYFSTTNKPHFLRLMNFVRCTITPCTVKRTFCFVVNAK